MTTFTNTLAAMRVYEASLTERNAAWDAVSTDDDIMTCVKADDDALTPVRLAYHEDTKAFNSLDSCMRLAYQDIKRIALK